MTLLDHFALHDPYREIYEYAKVETLALSSEVAYDNNNNKNQDISTLFSNSIESVKLTIANTKYIALILKLNNILVINNYFS